MNQQPGQTQVGRAAPDFSVPCVAADEHPRIAQSGDFRGRWLLLVFYPRDFSFVCPTELTAFSARLPEFTSRDCDLLGISSDTIERHQEWLATPPDRGGLGPLQFPLAADPAGEVARSFGVWDADQQVSLRGLFAIDPHGVVQYSTVHNLSVGRSVEEVLRVVDALQSGGLCPVSWTSADGTIDVSRALQPGRVLGSYRIQQQLGSGTFGTVFSAWDSRLERTVALKVLRGNMDTSRSELLAEARAAAKVNHPNVCTIYAVEEIDSLPVIVMEYLVGRQLPDLISEGPSSGRAVEIALDVAKGLEAAHQLSVVHGDLKPANIHIQSDGRAKILDFGLARITDVADARPNDDATTEVEQAEQPSNRLKGISPNAEIEETLPQDDDGRSGITGTPAYMSPEQSNGQPATPASDSFSFGLLLFELLTGRKAYESESLIQIIQHLNRPDFAKAVSDKVEHSARPIVASLLDFSPENRPSMKDVIAKLGNV